MHPLTRFSKAHEIPLSRLAVEVGVWPSTLSRLVNYQRRPSAELMARIAAVTGGEVTAQALLEAHCRPTKATMCLGGKICNVDIVKTVVV